MTGAVSHISSRAVQVIIGVDTHKDQHVAVALDGRGVRLDEKHVPVATCGYEELERWSCDLGRVHAFGVEGTGSYGAGLARFLTDRSYTVVEVNRPDRSVRYRKGKSDPTDAEMAARAVLAGVAAATPKSGEGEVEMIRMLKSTKNSAVKARTQAVNQMKALVLTAPAELRETLAGLTTIALITRCKSFRPGRLDDPKAAAKYTLRSLACRHRQLNEEVQALEIELERLTKAAAPALVNAFRGFLCFPVRSQSNTCFIRQDQPASSQPRWRSPGQRGALSHRCGQVALRSAYPGIYASSHRRGNE